MTKTRRLLACLALPLALAACGSQTPQDAPEPGLPATAQAAALSLPEAPPAPCGAVFSPDPALLAETLAAAARWATATGCDVRVGTGGTRVRLVAEIVDDVGKRHPGAAYPIDGGFAIDVTPDRPSDALPHEFGHVLAQNFGHITDGEPLSYRPLMCNDGGRGFILAADVAFVCEHLPCIAFTPEA